MNVRQELGCEGEVIAVQYLSGKGLEILEQNYSCKMGEIDIIAKDKDEIVFIEVKTRSQNQYGTPGDAVTRHKKNHIYHVAEYYLMMHHIEQVFCRIDVVEVYWKHDGYEINYIKNSVIDKPCFKRKHVETEGEEWRDVSV